MPPILWSNRLVYALLMSPTTLIWRSAILSGSKGALSSPSSNGVCPIKGNSLQSLMKILEHFNHNFQEHHSSSSYTYISSAAYSNNGFQRITTQNSLSPLPLKVCQKFFKGIAEHSYIIITIGGCLGVNIFFLPTLNIKNKTQRLNCDKGNNWEFMIQIWFT